MRGPSRQHAMGWLHLFTRKVDLSCFAKRCFLDAWVSQQQSFISRPHRCFALTGAQTAQAWPPAARITSSSCGDTDGFSCTCACIFYLLFMQNKVYAPLKPDTFIKYLISNLVSCSSSIHLMLDVRWSPSSRNSDFPESPEDNSSGHTRDKKEPQKI